MTNFEMGDWNHSGSGGWAVQTVTVAGSTNVDVTGATLAGSSAAQYLREVLDQVTRDIEAGLFVGAVAPQAPPHPAAVRMVEAPGRRAIRLRD